MEKPVPWTIGGLAKRASVPIDTIRYYEKEGLLKPVLRRPSGYRIYSDDSLQQLNFIRRAQMIGFTLREIRELLVLSHSDHGACSHVRDNLRQKLAEVDSKLQSLLLLRTELRRDLSLCEKKLHKREEHEADCCPVLRELSSPAQQAPAVGRPAQAKTVRKSAGPAG